MNRTLERSYIAPRDVRPLALTPTQAEAMDMADVQALADIGIGLPNRLVREMAQAFAADDQQGLITTASVTTPIQFLQQWLPGFVRTITAPRLIDELVGIQTAGSWEDEEVVQGILEPSGTARPYGDYTPVPIASWNVNFERRSVVRFEQGIKVGLLEEARAARIRMNTAAEKRNSATSALEIQRNAIGFYGYNSGANRTYGFLNDPSLPAYVNVANGASASPLWSSKTFLEITADIRAWVSGLLTQSQGAVNPETRECTLALPVAAVTYLSVTNVQGTQSVRQWLSQTYPKIRVIAAPQLNAANGGANVAYLYAESVDDQATDGSRTWVQIVPAKFQALGVAKDAKGYVEDYTNATAGVMLKRPYAVYRGSGI